MADKKISALDAATTPLAGTEVLPIVQGGGTDKVSVANLTAGRAVDTAALTATTLAAFSPTILAKQVASTAGVAYVRAESSSSFVELMAGGSSYGTNYMGAKEGGLVIQTGTPDTYAMRFNIYNSSAPSFKFTYGSSNVITTDSSSNVTVNTGNLVVGTAGKGIDFSANTHAAGMTSELLNDYEEGTWTPTDGSGAGLTFTVTSATYTKIGRVVHCQFQITYPVTADASGARIGGIPFPTSVTSNAYLGSTAAVGIAIQSSGTTNFNILNIVGAGAVNNNTLSGALVYGTFTYFA